MDKEEPPKKRFAFLRRRPAKEPLPPSWKRDLLYLGRDLAIAFAIVGVVMAAVFFYTGVWPPMVVVESGSMQHSTTASSIGVIDTGDLVLVQHAPTDADVITYVEGRATGYQTYSDYGDVIVFHRSASPEATPIIHRPLMYVLYNETSGQGYDVPSLAGLRCGPDWSAADVAGQSTCSPYNLRQVLLYNATFTGAKTVRIDLGSMATRFKWDGYITMGDQQGTEPWHEPRNDPNWMPRPSDVIGKARGEIPWFGLIKLTLFPASTGCCDGWGDPTAPANSWSSLLVSLILIIAGPIAYDLGTSYLRKRKAATAAAASTSPSGAPDPVEEGEPASSDGDGSDEKTAEDQPKERNEEGAPSTDMSK